MFNLTLLFQNQTGPSDSPDRFSSVWDHSCEVKVAAGT